MSKITHEEFTKALSICHQYKKQISEEVGALNDNTIREFIQSNIGRMSTRAFNTLDKAIAKGHILTSELTAPALMKISGTGLGTITEIQTLIIKQ